MLEGRIIWFYMSKAKAHEEQDLEENLLSQQRNRLAMMENTNPADALVRMARHFLVQPGEEFCRLERIFCIFSQGGGWGWTVRIKTPKIPKK